MCDGGKIPVTTLGAVKNGNEDECLLAKDVIGFASTGRSVLWSLVSVVLQFLFSAREQWAWCH